jgi:hypothetical protein
MSTTAKSKTKSKGKASVKSAGEGKLEVRVERLVNRLAPDQRSRMASGDGCLSNPGGPSC